MHGKADREEKGFGCNAIIIVIIILIIITCITIILITLGMEKKAHYYLPDQLPNATRGHISSMTVCSSFTVKALGTG